MQPRPRRFLVDTTPLRQHPQFRRLWLGYLVSTFGSQVTVVAVPYQVFRLTHSSFDVGLVGLAQILPVLLGALAGGSIADAVDRRVVLLCSQSFLCLCSAGLLLNASGRHPALWPVYLLVAVAAGFSSTDNSTRSAVFVNLVEREQVASANALWQLLYQIGIVVGPAAAGLLIGRFGVAPAYGIDTVTFGASLFAVFGLNALPPLGGGTRFGWKSVREGLAFLRGRQALQGTFVIDLVAMVLGMPRALFPAIGIQRFHGGAEAVGFLYAAPGAGAMIGALFTGWVTGVRHQGRAVLVSVVVWGASIAVFGVLPWLWPALAALALAGAADVMSAVFRSTILQMETPDEIRGRVSSIHTAVVTGGPRLGDFEAGAAAALLGTQTSVISGGLGCLVGAAIVWRYMPRLARYIAAVHRERLEQ